MKNLSVLKKETLTTDSSHSLNVLKEQSNAILSQPRDLTLVIDGKVVTTSALLASLINAEHDDVLALINRYRANLTYHGMLQTQDNRLQCRACRTVFLNEAQASLLLSFVRDINSARVGAILLRKAFYEARKNLHCSSFIEYPVDLFHKQLVEELKRQQRFTGSLPALKPTAIVPATKSDTFTQ